MAQLEIRRRSGAIETHPLDRKSPTTIGSSSTADVRVDAQGVLAIECRVIWNGQAFVVNAVNPDGVPLNGTTVKKAALSDADVVRVGDVDIVFVDEEPAGKGTGKGAPADEITMKSVGDDDRIDYTGSGMSDRNPTPGREGNVSERSARGSKSDRPRPAKTAEESSSRSGKERSVEPPNKPERPGRGTSGRSGDERPRKPSRDLLDDDEDNGKEYAIPGLPADEPKGGRADMGSADPLAKVLAEVDPKEKRQKPVLSRGGGTVESQPEPRASLKDTLKSLMKPEPKRPGEQELHRSPLVVGMTVGAAVLLLTAGTLWFVLAREFMNRKYEAAQQQLDAGQYAQAIDGFTKFVAEYPRTEEAKKARVNIGKAQVEQALSGALPDWENGLKTLNEFVNDHRDTEEFQPGTSLLRTFARDSANRIALGAAETARTAKRRPLLAVSGEARTLLDLLSPADDKPEERLAAIGAALRAAEAAILQQETFDSALARMKAAIEAGTPLDALRAYRQLLDRYAVARGDRTIQSQLKAALEADQKAVRRSESASPPVTDTVGPEVVASTLARRVRA
ncbi:MAG: hypothetical protein NT069_21585, partial [Planctomycetota bacterium]|nr:hypothetical protein [Planctomycetota bacterium]